MRVTEDAGTAIVVQAGEEEIDILAKAAIDLEEEGVHA